MTTMKPDPDKIDEAVLALLYLTSFTEGKEPMAVTRAWKGHDWDALKRLHEEGFIGDPVNKAKSIIFTDKGYKQAERLFEKLFCN
jgi:uncharacterized protein DUF6429